jgi:hypothetical protein
VLCEDSDDGSDDWRKSFLVLRRILVLKLRYPDTCQVDLDVHIFGPPSERVIFRGVRMYLHEK